jgi:hypothetical protein
MRLVLFLIVILLLLGALPLGLLPERRLGTRAHRLAGFVNNGGHLTRPLPWLCASKPPVCDVTA